MEIEKLKNPPAIYRSAPFWSWNEKMQEERVSSQAKPFFDAGMGGFFMLSRSGLQTEYMGKSISRKA